MHSNIVKAPLILLLSGLLPTSCTSMSAPEQTSATLVVKNANIYTVAAALSKAAAIAARMIRSPPT